MSHQVLKQYFLKFPSLQVCAGSPSKQGQTGARPQDQIQLLVHRPREMSQYQKIIPCGFPRYKALDWRLWSSSTMYYLDFCLAQTPGEMTKITVSSY